MENPTIFIDSPYSNLLNKVVAEMISRDYTLKAIDNYVFQIEQFLNFVSSTEIEGADFRSYIQSIKGDTSLQALHFFFKEVLKPTVLGNPSFTTSEGRWPHSQPIQVSRGV